MLAFALATFAPAPALAQIAQDDPAARARFQFGPIAVAPSIAIRNLGVDSNVFNQDDDPRRDFTATVSPATDVYFRVRRLRTAAHVGAEFIYFQKFRSQRSVDGSGSIRGEVRLNRFSPFAAVGRARSSDRNGYEIDARATYRLVNYACGTDVRLVGKASLALDWSRRETRYDPDEEFRGVSLRQVLDRDEDSLRLTMRYLATPLTRLTLTAERGRDRFEFDPIRDSDSTRVTVGVEFDPFGIISGQAHYGFRNVDFLDTVVPGARNAVADASVAVRFLGSNRVQVGVQRDVQYSYDSTRPYYLLTSVDGRLTRALSSHWDVQASAGGQRLAYRPVAASTPAATLVDRRAIVGLGAGFRVRPDVRAGVQFERYRRLSGQATRAYEGYRFGLSLTYGS